MKKVTLNQILEGRSHVENPIPDEAIDPNDVMTEMCATCPWRGDGNAVQLSPEHLMELTLQIAYESNQRCHAPSLAGKVETKICRGARDIQLRIFCSLGVLKEPTDAAWAEALEKIRSESEEE